MPVARADEQDVAGIHDDEIVEAADGNELLPVRSIYDGVVVAAAEDLAERMKTLTVNIVSKGGEGGRLFGSITSKDISEALEEQHGRKTAKAH